MRKELKGGEYSRRIVGKGESGQDEAGKVGHGPGHPALWWGLVHKFIFY